MFALHSLPSKGGCILIGVYGMGNKQLVSIDGCATSYRKVLIHDSSTSGMLTLWRQRIAWTEPAARPSEFSCFFGCTPPWHVGDIVFISEVLPDGEYGGMKQLKLTPQSACFILKRREADGTEKWDYARLCVELDKLRGLLESERKRFGHLETGLTCLRVAAEDTILRAHVLATLALSFNQPLALAIENNNNHTLESLGVLENSQRQHTLLTTDMDFSCSAQAASSLLFEVVGVSLPGKEDSQGVEWEEGDIHCLYFTSQNTEGRKEFYFGRVPHGEGMSQGAPELLGTNCFLSKSFWIKHFLPLLCQGCGRPGEQRETGIVNNCANCGSPAQRSYPITFLYLSAKCCWVRLPPSMLTQCLNDVEAPWLYDHLCGGTDTMGPCSVCEQTSGVCALAHLDELFRGLLCSRAGVRFQLDVSKIERINM